MNRSFKTWISLVVTLLVISQTVDAKPPHGRRIAQRCIPGSVTDPVVVLPATNFSGDTSSQPAATRCLPKAACCVQTQPIPVPVIESIPQFQPANMGILLADDPWTLINSQINALQLEDGRIPVTRTSIGRSLALRGNSREALILDREATG